MKQKAAIALVSALLAIAGRQPATAQVVLTGTNYAQNFNSLDSGLPEGWTVRTNASATNLGTVASFTTTHTNWGASAGQFANFASSLSNSGTNFTGFESSSLQSACTNRLPGIRQTGTFGDPGSAFVLALANTSGRYNFQVGLDFVLLSEQARSNLWTLDYAVGDVATNFIPVATFGDPGQFGAIRTNLSLGTALDDAQQSVWIRLAALKVSSGSGLRDTVGLDNFTLSWTASPNTPRAIPLIRGLTVVDGNVQIDFLADTNDTANVFQLQCGDCPEAAFSDAGALINALEPGIFRATCAATASQQFYRVGRLTP